MRIGLVNDRAFCSVAVAIVIERSAYAHLLLLPRCTFWSPHKASVRCLSHHGSVVTGATISEPYSTALLVRIAGMDCLDVAPHRFSKSI